jgi:N-methylhydantoinase A
LGTAARIDEIRERFERAYSRLYGHVLADSRVDFVALRVTVTVPPRDSHADISMHRVLASAPRASVRKAYFGREYGLIDTPVINRQELSASPRPGPLIIEEYEGTTVVPPYASASRDAHDNIVITLNEERRRA